MKKEAIKIEEVINKWYVELGNNLKNIKGDPVIVSYIHSGFCNNSIVIIQHPSF